MGSEFRERIKRLREEREAETKVDDSISKVDLTKGEEHSRNASQSLPEARRAKKGIEVVPESTSDDSSYETEAED